MKARVSLSLLGTVCLLGLSSWAQVIYDSIGAVYVQNFDSLAASGSSIPWSNGNTLTGWFLYRQPVPGVGVGVYTAGSGSSTAGSFYSFGASSSGERALGGVGSGGTYFGSPANGGVAGWIAVGLVNHTGQTLKQISVSYDGEQWRNSGDANLQTMRFEYGWGSSFTTVTSWVAPGGAFDWSSPIFGNPAGAVDGNTTGLVAGRGGLLNNLLWDDGETLWLRWIEVNDLGNDHGLAIDNFALIALVPEPATAAMWTGFGLLVLALVRCQVGYRANSNASRQSG